MTTLEYALALALAFAVGWIVRPRVNHIRIESIESKIDGTKLLEAWNDALVHALERNQHDSEE